MSASIGQNTDELRLRFFDALVRAGASRPGDRLFDELVTRYGEDQRRYHTLAHVEACLAWFDWYRGSAQYPERVELALWFHDAVYDPRASDNEARSAWLARERLEQLGVLSDAIADIERHILATREHAPGSADSNLVVDLDLTILGSNARAFELFEQQIRDEYAYVPDAAFALGRSSVLRGFLARAEIYRVPLLCEELERRARSNLERRVFELGMLEPART